MGLARKTIDGFRGAQIPQQPRALSDCTAPTILQFFFCRFPFIAAEQPFADAFLQLLHPRLLERGKGLHRNAVAQDQFLLGVAGLEPRADLADRARGPEGCQV